MTNNLRSCHTLKIPFIFYFQFRISIPPFILQWQPSYFIISHKFFNSDKENHDIKLGFVSVDSRWWLVQLMLVIVALLKCVFVLVVNLALALAWIWAKACILSFHKIVVKHVLRRENANLFPPALNIREKSFFRFIE